MDRIKRNRFLVIMCHNPPHVSIEHEVEHDMALHLKCLHSLKQAHQEHADQPQSQDEADWEEVAVNLSVKAEDQAFDDTLKAAGAASTCQ